MIETMIDWSSRIENAPKEDYNQLLYDATVVAEPQHVSRLLALGACIIPMNETLETALHYAAKHGLVRKLELLTKVCENVDLKDIHKLTPLYYAAVKGHKQCLIKLLHHPKEPECKLEKALEHAVREKHSETVKTLLDYGLDKYMLEVSELEECKHLGRLMELAVKNVDKDTINVLLEKGFSINRRKFTEITIEKRGAISQSRYKNKPDYTCSDNQVKGYESNPIIKAVEINDLLFVQWLVEKGAKFDIPILKVEIGCGAMSVSQHGVSLF